MQVLRILDTPSRLHTRADRVVDRSPFCLYAPPDVRASFVRGGGTSHRADFVKPRHPYLAGTDLVLVQQPHTSVFVITVGVIVVVDIGTAFGVVATPVSVATDDVVVDTIVSVVVVAAVGVGVVEPFGATPNWR